MIRHILNSLVFSISISVLFFSCDDGNLNPIIGERPPIEVPEDHYQGHPMAPGCFLNTLHWSNNGGREYGINTYFSLTRAGAKVINTQNTHLAESIELAYIDGYRLRYVNNIDSSEGYIFDNDLQLLYDEITPSQFATFDPNMNLIHREVRYSSGFLRTYSYQYQLDGRYPRLSHIVVTSQHEPESHYDVTTDEFGNILSIISLFSGNAVATFEYNMDIYNPLYKTATFRNMDAGDYTEDFLVLSNMCPNVATKQWHEGILRRLAYEVTYEDVMENGFPLSYTRRKFSVVNGENLGMLLEEKSYDCEYRCLE